MTKKIEYKPEKCECCGQTTTYVLALDRGTTEIVKAIARFIGKKGINRVHPRKEIEGHGLSSNAVGNLSRPRFHGLIARVEGEPGNYLLTRKGAKFLRGEAVPRYAIISKAEGKQIGYYMPEEEMINIKRLQKEKDYWEGINYDITEGHVITRL